MLRDRTRRNCSLSGTASKPKLAFPSKPGDPSRLDAGRGESRSVRPVRSVVVYEPRPVVVIVVHSEPKRLSLSIKVESLFEQSMHRESMSIAWGSLSLS